MPLSIGQPSSPVLALELPRIESPTSTPTGSTGSPSSTAPSFADQLNHAVQEVDNMAKTSQRLQNDFANGRQNDLHGTMIAMGEADISMRLIAQVRNKCIDAYREIMRMGA